MLALHYVKVSIRQLLKHKSQTCISILGIVAGLFCFSVCSYYNRVMRFGDKAFSTYERLAEIKEKGVPYQLNIQGSDIDKIGPESFEAVAFWRNMKDNLFLDETNYCRVGITLCNPDYFNVFPTHCVEGSLESFVMQGNKIVVTTEFVKKYLANKSPLGTSLTYGKGKAYEIAAVIEPYPVGMRDFIDIYEVFLPLENLQEYCSHTLLLKNSDDAAHLTKRLQQGNFFRTDRAKIVPEVTLASEEGAQYGMDFWVAVIGLFILLAGMINFFSFSFGSFVNRYREFNLRFTLGEKKRGLFVMLLIEQSLMISMAGLLTLALIEGLLPYLFSISPSDIRDQLTIDNESLVRYAIQYTVWLLIIAVILITCSIWYIRRQIRAWGLRQKVMVGHKHLMQNVLLVVQLFFSFLFIMATVAVQLQVKENDRQANPRLSMDEKKNIMVLNVRSTPPLQDEMQVFLGYLRSRPWCYKLGYIGCDWVIYSSFTEINLVSDDYFDVMNIEKKHRAGESFCYVNEALMKTVENDSLSNAKFHYKDGNQDVYYPVTGTIAMKSESMSASQLCLLPFSDDMKIEKIFVRLAENASRSQVLADMKKEMSKYLPVNEPFQYVSLYDEQVGGGLRVLSGLFMICSLICAIIAALGIYGVIYIDTSRRQKEVAIRKINGARLTAIYWLFGKKYLWIYSISSLISVIGCLFIFILGNRYRIIQFDYTNPFLWIIPLVLVAGVVLFTVSWKIYRIAQLNPADIIKSE